MNKIHYKHGPALDSISSNSKSGFTTLQNYLIDTQLQNESTEDLLSPGLQHLFSPYLLPDMQQAVAKIHEYIADKKHIMLYGDRDSDGVLATTILAHELRSWIAAAGGKLTVKTTSADDDYGLCPNCLENIKEISPDLLITIDFGSTNYNEINNLYSNTIETIVLDHHEIPQVIPKCLLINPKRNDSVYPDKNICSSLLALKLVKALHFQQSLEFDKHYWLFADGSTTAGNLFVNGTLKFTGNLDESKKLHPMGYYHYPSGLQKNRPMQNLFFYQLTRKTEIWKKISKYTTLSATGTITDLMPLQGENRQIVIAGLKEFSRYKTEHNDILPGMYYLIQDLELFGKNINSHDIGWLIGPAINAAGRMGKTEIALDLLLAQTEAEARQLSSALVAINKERKERTKRNIKRSDSIVETHDHRHPIVFCYSPEMEPGVSGIVASRLVNQFNKPAVFIAHEKEYAKGSVRSSSNKEDILSLLREFDEYFIQFGGHAEAAGFSIKHENIESFREELIKKSYDWIQNEKQFEFTSSFSLDPEKLNKNLYSELALLEPFGQSNPNPLISLKASKPMGLKPMGNGEHASFKIQDCDLRFIIWNKAQEFEELVSSKEHIDLWGNLEENYFKSRTSLQFSVVHFQ